ncbi:hypothetical protein BLNAU_6087 [Blattamonas nauphoetae]|uniref:Uncharacterized protein n=1 Tax=Blattamonas nauphoetae TaxID=2049346 RepID=A0ABQ9Y565_9EUKA|nr:hypothetical protein BLNAU_6087 [Blattamonas nauphoetae]
MEKEADSLNSSTDVCLRDSRESASSLNALQQSFLNLDPNSNLSFDDKSTIYRSLVALVKGQYPFDMTLQNKAVQFLESLEPQWGDQDQATKLVTDLAPSSNGSPSCFVESILILLSSSHPTVAAAASSFMFETILFLSAEIRLQLVESDLIASMLATVQPQRLPITGNENIIGNLVGTLVYSVLLASPDSLVDLNITAAVEKKQPS